MFDFFPKKNQGAPVDFAALRRAGMCPVLETRAGNGLVVFARKTAPDTVAFAWFRLTPRGDGVVDCAILLEKDPRDYADYLRTVSEATELAPVSPSRAKSLVMHAVWRGEARGVLPPRQFAAAAALMDGVQVEDFDAG